MENKNSKGKLHFISHLIQNQISKNYLLIEQKKHPKVLCSCKQQLKPAALVMGQQGQQLADMLIHRVAQFLVHFHERWRRHKVEVRFHTQGLDHGLNQEGRLVVHQESLQAALWVRKNPFAHAQVVLPGSGFRKIQQFFVHSTLAKNKAIHGLI